MTSYITEIRPGTNVCQKTTGTNRVVTESVPSHQSLPLVHDPMSFIHENPVLVAPRPVRIATGPPHHTLFTRPNPVRLLSPPADRIVDRSPDIDDPRLSTDTSPRASPR